MRMDNTNAVATQTTTSTDIEHKKYLLNKFMLAQLKDEANDAECYLSKAEKAREIGDTQLASLLINNARDEIKHYTSLMGYVNNNFKDLKSNVLYPLIETLEEWVAELNAEISAFR